MTIAETTAAAALESYRFLVSGRVQGVGFREATRRQASGLALRGWVRNLADGRVEGLACGEPADLRTLKQWLHRGPPLARVDHLEWTPATASPEVNTEAGIGPGIGPDAGFVILR